MKEATCKKCGETKPVSAFYKQHYSRVSGLGECSECTKARSRANRFARLDYYREYDRGRGNRQAPGYIKKYRENNRAKYLAHNAVNNAVRDGKMIKPDQCEECDSKTALHGHHDNYLKPLDVRWLCAGCHHQWHAENGEAENAGINPKRKVA